MTDFYVTGFGKFQTCSTNPTQALVEGLSAELDAVPLLDGCRVRGVAVLETSAEASVAALHQLYEEAAAVRPVTELGRARPTAYLTGLPPPPSTALPCPAHTVPHPPPRAVTGVLAAGATAALEGLGGAEAEAGRRVSSDWATEGCGGQTHGGPTPTPTRPLSSCACTDGDQSHDARARAGRVRVPYAAPIVFLHLGVDTSSTRFQLERQAINEATFRCADERGWQPIQEPVVAAHGPIHHSLHTRLNLDRVCSILLGRGFEVGVSEDAGRFVCNWTYYHSLHLASCCDAEALFVHVPPFSVVSADAQFAFVRALMETIADLLLTGPLCSLPAHGPCSAACASVDVGVSTAPGMW